jgi:site-specific recombinase XerD
VGDQNNPHAAIVEILADIIPFHKLREKVLQPAADRAELGKIGWHSLWHSFATALDVAGARRKAAQEWMRRSGITTTMDVYTGTAERDKRETAGRVATAVLGKIQ